MMTDVSSLEFEVLLRKAAGDAPVLCDEPMSRHTTFKVGGPAQWFVVPSEISQMQAIMRVCADNGVVLRNLGLGSNVLVSDEGVRGVVMQIADSFRRIDVQGTRIVAQAGASNKEVAAAAKMAGLSGYEFACGIPGTIGGAAIMNAGAYDGEFKNVAESVECLDSDGTLVMVSNEDAQWGYRRSMMAEKGYLVVGATLALQRTDCACIQEKMDDLTCRRESKQPLEMPSAGSTFKRPAGYFAGKLIQDADMQGHTVGGAQVSKKHAGFVVNCGGATASDIRHVIADVQVRVKELFGVELQPEVRMWGFDD